MILFLISVNNRHFVIDTSMGEIRLTNQLNYDDGKYFYLLVKATDSPPDFRVTIMNLTIAVLDANDRVPIFTQKLYTASVPENQPNYNVTTVFVS